MAGIYIHIPYCRQACHYCSFHFSTSLKNKSELTQAIIIELEERSDFFLDQKIETLYFGGGTPSILSTVELDSIFSALYKNYPIGSNAEVTLEANPEDVDKNKLAEWVSLGINRLSIGIQSFSDKDLKFMNRAHTALQSHLALELCASSEIKQVNADLMFGLIDNSLEDWRSNLDKITPYDLDHLSIYNLTIEEQTVFSNWKLKNKIAETSQSLQQDQFYLASEVLVDAGYDHYEISNYAKPGKQAIHNTSYWNRIPYLGIGPSAHSFNGTVRSWNIANNASYIKLRNTEDPHQNLEILDEIDQYNELVMLGLRTLMGVNKQDIKSLPNNINSHFNRVSAPLIKKGILLLNNDYLTLNRTKWYLSDHIISTLFISK